MDNSIQNTKLNMESPPEAAIEATPETTPFVTPVKDDTFKFVRPLPSSVVSRQLNLDATAKLKSPASISSSSILSPISSKVISNSLEKLDNFTFEKVAKSKL